MAQKKNAPLDGITIKSWMASPKGIAMIAAKESGLLPEIPGGWDTEAFERFWDIFSRRVWMQTLAPTEKPRGQDAQQGADNRTNKP